jgi:hypothetical protein
MTQEDFMTKALVLIDYENLVGGARDLGLELTKDGFQHFVNYLSDSYEIEDGRLNVVCRFNDFSPDLQHYLESLSCETIDAIDLGKDVADGYVIIEAITQLIENKDSIDEVVLVGGDNVYAGLVRTSVKKYRKSVKVISWGPALAKALTTVNTTKVHIEYPEDIFKIRTNEHLGNGWFNNDDCTDLEFAVISFILKSQFKDNFQIVRLANKLVDSTDTRVASLNDFEETKEWIMTQTGISDLFVKERLDDGRWYVKPNPLSTKVQYVLSRLTVPARP